MFKKEKTTKQKYTQRSVAAETWRQFRRNKGAMIGLAVTLCLILLAIFSGVLFDYDTDIIGYNARERLQGPSWEHPFGTDEFGRDIFARVCYGTRYSITIGLISVSIAFTFGVFFGALAGYYGGWVENLILRATDVLAAIPTLVLAMCIVSAMGASLTNLMIAVGVTTIPTFVRITRASVLTIRNQEYIEAAKAIGMRDLKIIWTHIIPNCMAPILVQSTLLVGSAVIGAAGLSFLGMGIPAPDPEWGSMLAAGRGFIRDYSYMTFFPGLLIMISVLALNMVGDGLRDAFDPKLRK